MGDSLIRMQVTSFWETLTLCGVKIGSPVNEDEKSECRMRWRETPIRKYDFKDNFEKESFTWIDVRSHFFQKGKGERKLYPTRKRKSIGQTHAEDMGWYWYVVLLKVWTR